MHHGQIADAKYKWEGPIAEQLELTRADVTAISELSSLYHLIGQKSTTMVQIVI